jgi:hypothetical protein
MTTPKPTTFKRSRRLQALLKKAPLLVAFWALGHGASVFGADFDPTTNIDGAPGGLRDMISQANLTNTDDRIRLAADTTYTLTVPNPGPPPGIPEDNNVGGDLDITRDGSAGVLTIEGQGPNTVVDAAQLDRVFHITNGGKVVFRNLTIKNGKAVGGGGAQTGPQDGGQMASGPIVLPAFGGGILNGGGTITLENVVVESNTAEGSTPSFTFAFPLASTFFVPAMGAPALGGGIYSEGGSLTLTGCTIRNNSAIGGDGAALPSFTLPSSTSTSVGIGFGGFAVGGGICCSNSTLTITSSTIRDNAALGGVGGHGWNATTTTPRSLSD